MAEFNEMNNDVVSGVEHVKKGKGKLVAGITAGALVVVAGGSAIAYAASDYVKNQVKLAVSSPENYYAWINEKNAEDFAKQISEQYRTAIDEMKSGQKSSVSLKYEISEDVRNLLIDDLGEEQEVIDIIKNFNDISVSISGDAKNDISSGSASVAWNGENLTTFDMAFDASAMDIMFRIPELTEQWLDIDADDIYGYDYYDDDNNKAINASEKISKDPESVITPEELETEITKYSNLWNECIADVELEKKADIAISDITVNYTVASVTIDETKAKEIAEKFINTAKEDEILKAIVVDRLEVATAEEYTADLDDVLADIAENYDENSTETVTLNTYIDPTGCIRGISFETSENDSAKFIVGKDGDEIRGEFTVSEEGENEFNAILTATDNGGKYSGALDMTADSETVSIEFTDLETVDDKKGYMNGVLTLVLPADAEVPPISVSLSSDGNSQKISAPIDIDGTNYGTIVLDVASETGAEPSMPDKSGAFVIDENTDAELSDYVARDKMEEFIKNILLKVGFSEEMADEGAKAFGEELYYDYSADFDYDDYDTDFSYDGNDDYDWDNDNNPDKDDLDIDDLSFDDDVQNDLYYNDMVAANKGQAYMCVIDTDLTSSYSGYEGDTLGYNAVNADINGDGTYTVKVTADTDGYRNVMNGKKPNGIAILAVEAENVENADNAVMEIKSVKIDGKEYEISNAQPIKYEYDIFSAVIYMDEMYSDSENIIDASAVGEWTDIEVTFEVKGME